MPAPSRAHRTEKSSRRLTDRNREHGGRHGPRILSRPLSLQRWDEHYKEGSHDNENSHDNEGLALSSWSLGIFFLLVVGLLIYAAGNSKTSLSLEERSAPQAETTGGPALPQNPHWPAPPSLFE